jgi:hypothetical protein
MSLLKSDVGEVRAVAGVPAQRGSPEHRGLIDQEEDDLESVREADKVELRRSGEGNRRVTAVERPAETSVRGTLGGHERMFA